MTVFRVRGLLENRENFTHKRFQRPLLIAADVEFHRSRRCDGIHTRTSLDDADVVRAFRFFGGIQIRNHGARTAQRMGCRTDDSEFMQTVAARPGVGNAEALAADAALEYALRGRGIDGDETVVIVLGLPQRLAAAKIPVAFFAQSTDENNIPRRTNAVFGDGPHDLKKIGKPAGVVRNPRGKIARAFLANLDFRSGRKHRIEVSPYHENRPRSRTFQASDDIADGVKMDVRQSGFFKQRLKKPGAFFFGKRGSRCFSECDLLLNATTGLRLNLRKRLLYRSICLQSCHRLAAGRQTKRQVLRSHSNLLWTRKFSLRRAL